MPVPFRCSSCNQELLAEDDELGTRIHCPACGAQIFVPCGPPKTVSFLSPGGSDSPASDNAGPGGLAGRSDRSRKADENRRLAEYLGKNVADMKYASRRVFLPGVLMIAISFLGFVANAVYFLEYSFHLGIVDLRAIQARMSPNAHVPQWAISGPFPVTVSAVEVVASVVILVGSIQMLYLEKYWLAYTAAILATTPCFTSCCCMPIGIWAIVVLNDSAVKLAFKVRRDTGGA
jgi:DNA-directed RNA polymerase subunit RPC12/RpoP